MNEQQTMELVMRVIKIALRKAEEEELFDLRREELNIYVPKGLDGGNIVQDLCALESGLTQALAVEISENLNLDEGMPDEEVTAEEYAMSILESVDRRTASKAGLWLETQGQNWWTEDDDELFALEMRRANKDNAQNTVDDAAERPAKQSAEKPKPRQLPEKVRRDLLTFALAMRRANMEAEKKGNERGDEPSKTR